MSQLTVTSPFVGVGYVEVLRAAIQEAETFKAGVVGVHTGFNKALHFPKLALTGTVLQDYDPAGIDTTGSATSLAWNEQTKIALRANMFAINNIDPNDFRDVFEAFQLPAETLYTFPSLPPAVQVAFILEILEQVSDQIDKNLWLGDVSGADPIDRFDGWLTQLYANGDFVDATPTGATSFTAANIFAAMDVVVGTLYTNARMKAVESRRRNELKIFVSKNTANLLKQAEQNVSGKGMTRLTSTSIYDIIYSGVAPVVPLAAFPDDTIMLTYASGDIRKTNLHFGATNVRDQENLQIERLANLSNYVGMRMDMSLGCVVGFEEEVILYTVPA